MEPQGAPLEASGGVLGSSKEAQGWPQSRFYAVTDSLLRAVFSAHGEAQGAPREPLGGAGSHKLRPRGASGASKMAPKMLPKTSRNHPKNCPKTNLVKKSEFRKNGTSPRRQAHLCRSRVSKNAQKSAAAPSRCVQRRAR